jgi:hypothetical protein
VILVYSQCSSYDPRPDVYFFCRPRGRAASKRELTQLQTRWNAVVDEYILADNDKRSKTDIEHAAKIGSSNGALYRRCEGKGCDKEEGRGDVTLSQCTKCKIVSALHVLQMFSFHHPCRQFIVRDNAKTLTGRVTRVCVVDQSSSSKHCHPSRRSATISLQNVLRVHLY